VIAFMIVLAIAFFVFLIVSAIKNLLYIAPPNKVIIFSGISKTPRVIKGSRGYRAPIFERVDSLDLSNMVVDLSATNAYAKGGVPVTVHGVANVKIAGHQPVLNNAIERFLGKSRAEIMGIAKATLEGSLRGVLATLTPEQLNEDRNAFAEQLVSEVEGDMTSLGLVVDTLKIQNITDDVHYLDSIGRIRNSELQSTSRVAEAIARADSVVRSAENSEQEVRAEVTAAISVAKANAEKNLVDIISRRDALVAEEKAAVAALVAQAEAEVNVQKARIDQVRSRLDADVIQPAKAGCDAAEQDARASVATIIEDGKARAEALKSMATSWNAAGDQAREIFLLQKIEPIIGKVTETISAAKIDKVTVIDSSLGGGSAMSPARLLALSEQVKEVFGIDVVAKLQEMSGPRREAPAPVVHVMPAPDKPKPPEAPPKQR
jgi:flotillin